MWKGISLIGILFTAACGGYASTTPTPTEGLEATLSSIQENIFTPTCATAGCHSATSAAGGLSLASGEAFGELVGVESTEATGVNRVTASDSADSYLINKLEGAQSDAGGSGVQMPKNASALTTDQINTIKEWIDAGAENN